ncbi:nucleoside 2-deoxyribosyltransferase domain-containing protein [Streptomyces sp. NPDC058084]|uniref:nucleoside 2-deoxyribosyltransferase domain-containing protein n=1 Tax=Streptomyces sp. NPDC058084 TaxID=3346333 RepID=UPI0036EA5026
MRYVEAPEGFTRHRHLPVPRRRDHHCPDWQQTAAADLAADLDIAVFNPRRSSFPVHAPDAESTQVRWEYRHLRRADLVLFSFPASPSHQPITLYELGMAAADHDTALVVGADPEYVRRAYIAAQLSHTRPGLPVHTTLADTHRGLPRCFVRRAAGRRVNGSWMFAGANCAHSADRQI